MKRENVNPIAQNADELLSAETLRLRIAELRELQTKLQSEIKKAEWGITYYKSLEHRLTVISR